MSLSKKHFVKVAEILNQIHKEIPKLKDYDDNDKTTATLTLGVVTENLCHYFATENPLFNREKFRQAVLKGVE